MRNKAEIEKRWRNVYNSCKESFSKMKALYLDPIKNANFFSTAGWSSDLSGLGKAEYVLNKNVVLFQQYLRESVLVEQELFENFEQGKRVDPSYVAMTGFDVLFEALASGDVAVAKGFAKHLGGRPEIEKTHTMPFAIDFGYTLKYFTEDADIQLKKTYLENLAAHCQTKRFSPFSGYVTVFEAILEKDLAKANAGFKEIVRKHDEEAHGRGDRYFNGRIDEDICVWGIGLANLAIHYGLPVDIDDPLIPKELLSPVPAS